jgi:CRISPR/Cas system-associated exonuclease Cas4 (RecB family)
MDQHTTTLPKVSASKIKTYQTCAKKYEYTYINKPTLETHTERKSIGGLLGTILHNVIEAKYKNPLINHLALYQDKMFATLEQWQHENYDILGEQGFSKQMKEGRRILETFNWEQFSPQELELYFTVAFPNSDTPFCQLVGFIDMISDDNVIDHKSQKVIETADEMAHNAQFILYRFAFHAMKGYYPNAVLWNDLRTGKLINTHVEENYDDKLATLTKDIQAMLSATEYPKIELGETCRRRCEFFKLCWNENGDV